ncbi:Peptidase S10 serine carboxypeptidase protein [Dioscorea alata]|uniref:Peptidase S10 serine carboxypeptidase protein n=2 Tax=Dioscorea alata TaxID=55571 RepID=A0ACB7WNK4_DIOAL|nr:Peptidase S10 serine carboxypeptidase protein [Dioscorea alata]KAH7689932.1 Peptidase S10 serine carboxypeptidase protein [Dioscorea alata]
MPSYRLRPQRLCQLLLLLWPLFISASIVTHLPGFHGPLPFHLETGYVGVDEVQFFYYFIESEGNPAHDPLLLWLTGGPGCSSFCALVFQNGPLKFRSVKYNGSLPTLVYHPFSWTKVSNMLFLDSPAGAGFSFSDTPETCINGDVTSSLRVHKFIRKWLIDHSKFLSNPLYVGGDSYAGKVVPFITHLISQGIESGPPPLLNLKGYLIGNPFTGEVIDKNARVPYAHNMGIISDEIYKSTTLFCEGEDYENPTKVLCAKKLQVVEKYFDEIDMYYILAPKCPQASLKPKNLNGERRFLKDGRKKFIVPSDVPPLKCKSYGYYLSSIWANDDVVRDALHIQKGTVPEWIRCNHNFQYAFDLPSNVKYQHNLTSRGYRALVYSGDHDLVVPHIGTQTWIRSLNYSIIDDWRSWFSGGQVAGYTRTYANNLTFATIKGAGHTVPEYKPKESLAMVKRWLSNQPL